MKFVILLWALTGCALAQRGGNYQASGANIAILRQDSDISPDGSYQWSYETENGISAQETGQPKGSGPEGPVIAAQGSYSYTAPDGTPIQVTYTSDEGGFQPQGAHLPVPPEIPAAIQRALAWIAAHPSADQDGPRPAGGRRF